MSAGRIGLESVTDAFLDQAAARPAAAAIIDRLGQMAYGELAERVLAVSSVWSRRIGPETEVHIELGRQRDCLVAFLAVLHCGGASALVNQGHSSIGDVHDSMLRLRAEDITAAPRERAAKARFIPSHPDAIAYICNTSGSTGRPKRVGVTHRALRNRLAWGQSAYPLGPGDRVLWQAEPGFDFAVWEMLAPLCWGAAVVVSDEQGQRDLRRTAVQIVEHGVTAAHFAPSVLRSYLRVAGAETLAGLRYLFLGGEQFDTASLRRLQVLPSVRIYNQYGPTETCIDSTWFECTNFAERDAPAVPIGVPIEATQISILGPDGVADADAVEGELGISGVGLARGYLGDPRATAERFVPSVTGGPGARVYRTGDVVRRREDGAVDFVGRKDDQLKVRGVRVELEEVRAAVRAAFAAADTAVTTVDDSELGKRIVAFVTGAESEGERALDQALHPAKRPQIVRVHSIPRLGSGKPDLRSLVEGLLARPDEDATAASEMPFPAGQLSSTEERLTKIWADLLRVPAVSPTDNFFDLGGHSLLATELLAILEETFRIELPLRQIFDCDSLVEMARVVDGVIASTALPLGRAS